VRGASAARRAVMEGARRVPGWTPVDFLILRHGQTTWNARGIIQGQADAPLDDIGKAQARALASFLTESPADGDARDPRPRTRLPRPGLPVVTSDLSRAVDTARALADALVRISDGCLGTGEDDVVVMTQKLRERHVGRLQGVARDDARRADPKAWRAFVSRDDSQRIPDDGESYDDLWDRTVGFVENLATTTAAKAENARAIVNDDDERSCAGTVTPLFCPQPIALVTHGGVARVLLDRCARDANAFSGTSDEVDERKSETPETENIRKIVAPPSSRPGVLPNCSVGLIRVHVPPFERRKEEEQIWEALVWGEASFLERVGGNAANAEGKDYA